MSTTRRGVVHTVSHVLVLGPRPPGLRPVPGVRTLGEGGPRPPRSEGPGPDTDLIRTSPVAPPSGSVVLLAAEGVYGGPDAPPAGGVPVVGARRSETHRAEVTVRGRGDGPGPDRRWGEAGGRGRGVVPTVVREVLRSPAKGPRETTTTEGRAKEQPVVVVDTESKTSMHGWTYQDRRLSYRSSSSRNRVCQDEKPGSKRWMVGPLEPVQIRK